MRRPNARSLAASLNLDVRTSHRVTGIDKFAQKVTIQAGDDTYALPYDALLLSPGAVPVRPPIKGLDHPAVHTLRTIPDVDSLRERIEELLTARGRTQPGPSAVVIGAAFIGLEAVEALTARGLQVHLVELADHVLPPLDAELAPLLSDELAVHGVDLRLGVSAQAVAPTGTIPVTLGGTIRESGKASSPGAVTVTLSDGATLAADLVIVNVGVRPASALAVEAGLEVARQARSGSMATSTPPTPTPGRSATPWRSPRPSPGHGSRFRWPVPPTGRGAGRPTPCAGAGQPRRPRVLGTAIVRVFDLTAATTGANQATLRRAGIAHEVVHIHPGDHAGYYPGSEQAHLVASFAPDGTLLGAQGVGRAGVDKRIDILATAIRAGMTADDLAELELAYAPPYGSAKDPVNMLGFVAQNVLDATMPQWQARIWTTPWQRPSSWTYGRDRNMPRAT